MVRPPLGTLTGGVPPGRRALLAGPLALPALLALLGAVGPVSTDMYLPAFPAMREALGADPSAAPLTLAAWFVGLAIGQLVLGPLSDRTGRRPPLMLGAVVYVAGSLGCALATTMDQLLAWRCLAAIGGAASLVVPRAIIRDQAIDAAQAARIVARVQLIMAVVPMLTPAIGGLLVEASGWRSIFLATTLYGVAVLALIVFVLPETLPADRRIRTGAVELAVGYLLLARDRAFVTNTLAGALATFSLFAFLGGAPAVFLRHFGLSPTGFGLTFIANGLAYAAGTRLNAALIERAGARAALTWAVLALVAAACAMLLFAVTGAGGAWSVLGCFTVIMLVLGCVLPGAAIGAIGPHMGDAGLASALYGTAVFAIGALGTVLVGFAEGVSSMAGLMVGGAVMALGVVALRPKEERGFAPDPTRSPGLLDLPD